MKMGDLMAREFQPTGSTINKFENEVILDHLELGVSTDEINRVTELSPVQMINQWNHEQIKCHCFKALCFRVVCYAANSD